MKEAANRSAPKMDDVINFYMDDSGTRHPDHDPGTRHHSVAKDDRWHAVFCFSEKAHADLFRERFGGEPFDPSSRGCGSSWHVWREPKRKAILR